MRLLRLLVIAGGFLPDLVFSEQFSGDPEAGAREYVRCQGCHDLTRHRTGPRHCGLFGRRAGTVAGFEFTESMKNAKLRWDRQSLDEFLRAPIERIPGTSMGYAGISDKQVRHNLIAYLESTNNDPSQCPP